jgi:hypothetical protein
MVAIPLSMREIEASFEIAAETSRKKKGGPTIRLTPGLSVPLLIFGLSCSVGFWFFN